MDFQIRDVIVKSMTQIASEQGVSLVSPLKDDTVLLQSGLDSLCFAILVARLEEELGYDPFVLMEEPVYPRTLSELTDIYQKSAQSRA